MLRLKDAIDEKTLVIIQKMFMQFLHSSTALYEVDGTYSYSIFEGRYCSFLNDVSYKSAGNCQEEALCSGKWICHEDCLRISKESMEKKEPVEKECSGGISIYAVPVMYKDQVIGSINAGITNPPLERAKLESIAKLFNINVGDLTQHAYAHKRLLHEEMEIARMQIRMASLLISSLYETKVKQMEAEAEVKRQKELLETIINGMSDALIISDKNGKILKINNEAKRQYFQIAKTSVMGETRKTTRYMDLSRNEIQYEDMPGIRALRGEVIRNRKIIMQRPDKELVLDISCIPIFDEKENIEIIIACSRDITETFLHEQTVKIHQELLLKSEIEKRQALEDTIRLKDEFLYLITHEFKTPMAVVNSALQAISSVCRDDVTPRLDKYISIIKRNINRQLRLVNNLLDITCMNSGYMKMDKSNFDIVFVTKTIVNSVKLYSKQKEINLNFM